MTLDEIVLAIRQRAGDVDPAAYRFTKNQLVVLLAGARRTLAVRKLSGFADLAITTTEDAEAISPEPTDMQGTLLAVAAVVLLLKQRYTYLIDTGGMGIVWSSGLESESTVTAQKAYEARIRDVEREFDELLLISNSLIHGTRPQ